MFWALSWLESSSFLSSELFRMPLRIRYSADSCSVIASKWSSVKMWLSELSDSVEGIWERLPLFLDSEGIGSKLWLASLDRFSAQASFSMMASTLKRRYLAEIFFELSSAARETV